MSVDFCAITMKLLLLIYGTFLVTSIQCFDSESFESSPNGIELNPFYDAMIFSDIADIMKEFQSNSIPLFEKLAKDDSESDENVEDLLEEYQKYLDKEHKQRMDYVERTKLKNKVPLIRHDRFSKTNFRNGGKYNDNLYKNDYFNPFNVYKSKSPLDFLVPLNSKADFIKSTSLPRDSMELNMFKKAIQSESSPLVAVPPYTKHMFKSPCCKNENNIMNCNKCMTTKDYSQNQIEQRVSPYYDERKPVTGKKNADLNVPDDVLGIHIKVEFQLPKNHKKLQKMFDLEEIQDSSSTLRIPNSLYNFHFPMNMFGFTRVSKINSSPLHKISIHKKKKSKSTGGKKHRKKVITFHSIKLEPQQIYEAHFGKFNSTEGSPKNDTYSTIASATNSPFTTEILETNFISSTATPPNLIKESTVENIFIVVNISNNAVNDTEESHKTSNSKETEYTKEILSTTEISNSIHLLKKREVTSNATVVIVAVNKTTENKFNGLNKTERVVANVVKDLKELSKKVEKSLPGEEELLYWPNISINTSNVIAKNITTIMLESETRKVKINMTKDAMHKNHTKILEKAIFGDVDWNDVDTVVPAFISFIGKYIEGALTICSDKTCHSMKCGQKVCNHRVCAPFERFNNKGHCLGATITDSVATMESIMDLPSNLVFEIVDIIQDKMAGKLFGKETLCINSKCITFTAYKKIFVKHRCTSKELNSKGHCVISKEGKIV